MKNIIDISFVAEGAAGSLHLLFPVLARRTSQELDGKDGLELTSKITRAITVVMGARVRPPKPWGEIRPNPSKFLLLDADEGAYRWGKTILWPSAEGMAGIGTVYEDFEEFLLLALDADNWLLEFT